MIGTSLNRPAAKRSKVEAVDAVRVLQITMMIMMMMIMRRRRNNDFSARKRICSGPLARRSTPNGAGLDEAEPWLDEAVLAIVQA